MYPILPVHVAVFQFDHAKCTLNDLSEENSEFCSEIVEKQN